MRVTHNIQGYYNSGRLPLWWFLFVFTKYGDMVQIPKRPPKWPSAPSFLQVVLNLYPACTLSKSMQCNMQAREPLTTKCKHKVQLASTGTCQWRILTGHWLTSQAPPLHWKNRTKDAKKCKLLQYIADKLYFDGAVTDPPPSPQHGKNISNQLQTHWKKDLNIAAKHWKITVKQCKNIAINIAKTLHFDGTVTD